MHTVPVSDGIERRTLCADHATRLTVIEGEVATIKEELKPIRGIRNLLVVVSMLLAVLIFIYLDDRVTSKASQELLIKHSIILERFSVKMEHLEKKPGWQAPG